MKKILCMLVLIILLAGCGTKEENKIYGLYDKYVSNNLVFRNTDIKENDNIYTITSTLTNNSDKTQKIKWYKLNVVMENGKKHSITVYFGNVIEPHQTLQTTTSVDFDVNLIKSIDYEVN